MMVPTEICANQGAEQIEPVCDEYCPYVTRKDHTHQCYAKAWKPFSKPLP